MGMKGTRGIDIDSLKLCAKTYLYSIFPILLFRYILISITLTSPQENITRAAAFKSSSSTIGTIIFIVQAIAERNIFQLYFIGIAKFFSLLKFIVTFLEPRPSIWQVLISFIEVIIILY